MPSLCRRVKAQYSLLRIINLSGLVGIQFISGRRLVFVAGLQGLGVPKALESNRTEEAPAHFRQVFRSKNADSLQKCPAYSSGGDLSSGQ